MGFSNALIASLIVIDRILAAMLVYIFSFKSKFFDQGNHTLNQVGLRVKKFKELLLIIVFIPF